jgi:hypothetical protein
MSGSDRRSEQSAEGMADAEENNGREFEKP